MSHPLAVSL